MNPTPLLTDAELQAIVEAALVRLESAGVSAGVLETLAAVPVSIEDLSGGTLGFFTGTTILIDSSTARFGWFVDQTPLDDLEFTEDDLDPVLLGRFDLLTVVLHELAHAAGHPHIEGEPESSNHLLLETLPISHRRDIDAEALQAIFSNPDFTEELLSSLESGDLLAEQRTSGSRNRNQVLTASTIE